MNSAAEALLDLHSGLNLRNSRSSNSALAESNGMPPLQAETTAENTSHDGPTPERQLSASSSAPNTIQAPSASASADGTNSSEFGLRYSSDRES